MTARCLAGPALLPLALCSMAAAAGEPAALPLWPHGAPGSPATEAPELLRLSPLGEHIVSGVHRPSITPYLPASGHESGTAVIVIPGGGHRELWMDHEGYRVGRWLAQRGIAAFVLKYRLAQEPGSRYTVEGDELADVQRALRLVRSRAVEWHIDVHRLGVIGFSAGGELAALAATRPAAAVPAAGDPVERESAAPDFMGLIYPAIPKDMALSAATPPAFLLCGELDSAPIAEGVPNLYLALRRAGASAELHVLAGAGHGFGIRTGNAASVAAWPQLFYDWLVSRGLLNTAPATAAQLSETMRIAMPRARPVAQYSPTELAAAAQATLQRAAPPAATRLASLTPDAPFDAGGAHLSFWKPSFILGTADGGEAGINFWKLYHDGHVNVGFQSGDSPTLLDCRVLARGKISYRIYAGEAATQRAQGESLVAAGHMVLAIPDQLAKGAISVELRPSPSRSPIGFLGCDLWRLD